MGLGYVAAVLEKEGHQIDILDASVDEMPDAEVRYNLTQMCKRVDIFMTGALTPSFSYFERLLTFVRALNPKMKIIVGNSVVGSSPEMFIRNVPADFGVIGEGEITAVELVECIEDGGDPRDVGGIVFKEDGEVAVTEPRAPINNLDDVPFPAYDLFNTKKYVRSPFYGSGLRRKAAIISSRGCPYSCGFCYEELRGRGYRWRSAENVVGEIKFLQKNYGVRFISFSDPCFVINSDRVFELCDLMVKEKLNIKWAADGRANLAEEEMYKRMHGAGCRFIDHGFESGSNLVLKNMNKQATAEQAVEAVRICRKVGIVPSGTTMLGFPGETRDTIRETAEFRKKIDVGFCPTFFTTAYPSTPLWEWCVKNGRIRDPLAYIRSLGEMLDRPYVNCTEFSDDELVRLRDSTDVEVRREYVKRHPLWPAKSLVRRAYNYYKYYGVQGLVRRAVHRGA